MTVPNAFIFSWDVNGIESIVPIEQYRQNSKNQLMALLKDQKPERNPLNSIVQRLLLRAQLNSQRNYEIYAVDCDDSLDENFWKDQWQLNFEETAELIRNRGYKLF
jgi:hypothetical protein